MHKSVGIFAITCLALSLVIALSACRQDSYPSHNPEAVQLCDEGTADLHAFRFNDAVDKLGDCLDLDPELAEASIARAMAYANLQDNANARRELSRADSLTAEMTDERRRLLAQLRLSRISNSRFYAMGDSLRDRMSRQEPDNFYVLESLAENAEASGDPLAAIAIWERILTINPNHVAAYNKLGYLELNRGAYDMALEQLQKYIFLAPDLANPHDSYGEVLLTIGRYEEAEEEFRTSLRMQPDFYPSLINLGRSYLARGKVAKGTAVLNKVRQQIAGTEVERNVDLKILTTYLVAEQQEQLAASSRGYVGRYPSATLTPLLRCLILVGEGQAGAGFAVMDSTLAARRASSHYHKSERARTSAEIFASQYEGLKQDLLGNHAEAAKAWHRAIDLMASTTPYHEQFFYRSRLAGSLLGAGSPDKALAEIDAMLAVNPRLINVLVLKVEAQLERQDQQQATAAKDQLDWALSSADQDYAPRVRTSEFAIRIAGLSHR